MDTKKLRQKILDLAIRGKLVPQDPNDEPASVLLERIRAEKEQLIKEGKIKRSKKSATSDTSHYENVPFEVPESWVWCRLDTLCNIKGGKRIPKGKTFSESQTSHMYIRVTDMKKHTIIMSSLKYIDDDVFEEIKNHTIASTDLYLTIAGTIGDVGEVPEELNGANLTENAAKLTDIICFKKYLMYTLMSSNAQDHFSSKFHQVAQPKLSIETASSTLIPLPPYHEQKRIVNELDRIFNYIDHIELGSNELKEYISNLRATVLYLATTGKLVTHDPNDEPAINLLKRINPSYKSTDNRHYENISFPDSWEVVKMSELVNIISGVSYSKADLSASGIKVIRGGNIQDGEIIECVDDVYINSRYEDSTNNIVKGDLVLVASTGSQTLIGKTGFATRDYKNTQIGAFLRILRPKDIRCADFLNLIFQSDYYRQYIRSLAKGTNINNVKNSYIEDFVIGLPPLQEQNRIVTFTNQIFNMMDEILADL